MISPLVRVQGFFLLAFTMAASAHDTEIPTGSFSRAHLSATTTIGPTQKDGIHILENKDYRFEFKSVSGQNLYFGEWSRPDNSTNNRELFLSAPPEERFSAPTTDIEYTVNGINNGSLLSGVFSVTHDQTRLRGTLAGSGMTINISSDIDKAAGTFQGIAHAQVGDNKPVAGTAQGNFYEGTTPALLGTARFEQNPEYNTSFGGAQTSVAQ